MSRPLTVTIPHSLGRAAARQRIEDGITQLRTTYAGQFSALEETWTGDRLDFRLTVLKQAISGNVEVADTAVTVSVILPIFLAMLAEKVKTVVQQRGQLMLEHKG